MILITTHRVRLRPRQEQNLEKIMATMIIIRFLCRSDEHPSSLGRWSTAFLILLLTNVREANQRSFTSSAQKTLACAWMCVYNYKVAGYRTIRTVLTPFTTHDH